MRQALALGIIVGLFVARPVMAADVSSLEEENARLKARIAELEAEMVSFRKVEPRPTEPVAEEHASGGWLEQIHEGLDRADRYFYVEDTKAWLLTEYWFDTRGYQTLNLTGASRLPAGWSVWGFIDVDSADASDRSRIDKREFFLRWIFSGN
jgi:hypothetical protein